MAIKLFRHNGTAFVEVEDMIDIEIGSGEEREVEEKSYISREEDYKDFDVGTSSAPELTVTFDGPVSDLESDYDDKTRSQFGILYTENNLEVLYSKANVIKRQPVKAGTKMRRQYTIKTAGKPTVNTPASTLTV